MNPSSIFLRVKENILIEFIYAQEAISGASKKYLNTTDKTQYFVNDYSMRNLTNNVETLFSVNDNNGQMAVVDVNNGFHYPDVNNAISSIQLPHAVGVKYDTIRVHIRSGYNFQDCKGFHSEVYISDISGNRISLLSQVAFKSDLSILKYNNTPIRISEVTFDKFVEYKVLSVSELMLAGSSTNTYFSPHFSALSNNPIIHFDFSFINISDTSSGYIKFHRDITDTVHFPSYDGYNKLQPNLTEQGSFFEYSAMWDNNNIEDFITILNSKAGNRYHIEHEIAVYEQRGMDFYEIHRHNTIQKFNYDKPMRFRPILTDAVDGSMQVEYIMRFFNSADNTSIVKKASLNSLNTNVYLVEPLRINIPINNVHKLYNNVVRKDINIGGSKKIPTNKIVVPIYYDNKYINIDNDSVMISIVPFDNVYSININKETNGQNSPYPLNAGMKYQMVFDLVSGDRIRVFENDISGKLSGTLNFKISSSQASSILKDVSGKFYINTVTDSLETNLVVGNWKSKDVVKNGKIDEILMDEVIGAIQPTVVIEEVDANVPIVTMPITDENVATIGVIKPKPKTIKSGFTLADVPENWNLNPIENPVVGSDRVVSILPNGSNVPVKVNIQEADGFVSIDKQSQIKKNLLSNIIKTLGLD